MTPSQTLLRFTGLCSKEWPDRVSQGEQPLPGTHLLPGKCRRAWHAEHYQGTLGAKMPLGSGGNGQRLGASDAFPSAPKTQQRQKHHPRYSLTGKTAAKDRL